MFIDEPNWTYRDLLSCTLAEVEAILDPPDRSCLFEDAASRAWGAVTLWLRLTDESRSFEDLLMLVTRVNFLCSQSKY